MKVSDSDGAIEGVIDGLCELNMSVPVGAIVGTFDCSIVGATLGSSVGDCEGATEGTIDGLSGLSASTIVGASVGNTDGGMVGTALGTVVAGTSGDIVPAGATGSICVSLVLMWSICSSICIQGWMCGTEAGTPLRSCSGRNYEVHASIQTYTYACR